MMITDDAPRHNVAFGLETLVGKRGIRLSGGQRPSGSQDHRLSTAERCDRLYRVEEGRIVTEGASVEILSARKFISSV